MSKMKTINKINKNKMKNKTKSKTNTKTPFERKVRFDLNKNKTKETFEKTSISSVDDLSDEESIEGSVGSDNAFNSIVDHKKSLDSLKEKDSEFYEFLQQNDKHLLDFDLSDEDLDEDNDLDEDLDETDIKEKISVKRIDEWSEELKTKVDIKTIKSIVKVFRKAVNQTSGESEGQVLSPEVFNGIVNICLIDLLPAIHRFLKLPQIGSTEWSTDVRAIDPTKSRNWKKVISIMKCYLTDAIKMVGIVSESSLKATLLRHILHLMPFIITFPHLIKRVLKQTIILWSESDDKNRVLSFICILRLIRTQEQPMISFILKKLYISYVKNCKFMSETNWSLINFMKHSLVELYSLDPTIAYQHSFIFIRQLAISLRTAMTMKKKESYKTVYNWQFLHSILLWTHLLSTQSTVDELKPLICPIVNVIIGTIRLIPSAQFFPMRFHLIKALIRLSEDTNAFIPVLPLITEVFECFDKTKKNKPKDEKQLNFDLIIKVSKINSTEFEFKNSTINKVYDLMLYYLSTQAHRIAFPELVQISIIKIRKFVKRWHIIQHNQLLRQLLEKIEENAKYICDKRRSVEFSINDILAINSWEREVKCDGTPLHSFYIQLKKVKSDKDVSDIVLDTNEDIEENGSDDAIEATSAPVIDTDNTNDKKRKSIETESTGNSKQRKVKRNRRKRNKNKKTKLSFDLNQSLNISSDESN